MVQRLLFLLIFSIINIIDAKSCSCVEVPKERLLRKVDLAVFGIVISSIQPDQSRPSRVLIKVNTLIKGRIKNDTIAIFQSNSNCFKTFEVGEKYLVLGYRIKRFKRGKLEESIDSLSFEPPSFSDHLRRKKMFLYEENENKIKTWNSRAKKEIVVYTSLCLSFHKSSVYTKNFMD